MDLLIVGASVRAAAFSALRAGVSPRCVDLFADRDLAAVAPCLRVGVASYPAGLIDAAETLPPCPWVYTGGLENHPGLIERLSRSRPLLGNPPEVLSAVRDPVRVFDALSAAGFPALPVETDAREVPADGTWLRKPLASTGGLGVETFDGSVGAGRCYYQRRVRGLEASAVFLGRGDGAELKGVTRQLIGQPGAEFGYRGSVAPWPVGPELGPEIAAIGGALARAFGLVGLFGADLILEGGRAWVVEVNPRYTASVEVIELASGRALLGEHRDACTTGRSDSFRRARGANTPRPGQEDGPQRGPEWSAGSNRVSRGRWAVPTLRDSGPTTDVGWAPPTVPGISERAADDGHRLSFPVAGRCVAKEVLFADFEITAGPIEFATPDPFEVPGVADLPEPGTRFAPGEPILTVFGQGPTVDDADADLAANAAEWRGRLGLA